MGKVDDPIEWIVEDVPNEDHLYMRVHKNYWRGRVLPGVFREHGGGMSTDWCKYSTPETTRSRARKPSDNGVLSLPVGGVRSISGLSVMHTPDIEINNRAHTDVKGIVCERKTEIRVHLLRLHQVEIPL